MKTIAKDCIALTLVCVLTLSSVACFGTSTKKWAGIVVSSLREAQPLLVSVGLPADKINTAIEWGDKLVVALNNPDNTTSDPKKIAENLINAFEQVVLQTDIIQDQQKKTLILAILGIANIALHNIVDDVTSNPSARKAAGPVVLKFKQKTVWRCRNAKSGKWEKMEFCKANPATSVVETYR